MSCKNFKELMERIQEITEMRLDSIALVWGVSEDSLRIWSGEDKVGSGSAGREFTRRMNSKYKDLNDVFDMAKKSDPTKVHDISEEDWDEIQDHYKQWRKQQKTHSAQPEPPTRLATSSVMFKILRWQNRQAVPSPNPFYTKTIGGEGSSECIPVHDEAVGYRSATLHTPVARTLETEIRTSGDLLEPIRIWPRHPEPEQEDSIIQNDLGGSRILDNLRGSLRLSFKMTEEDHEILYGARIFNGFQKGWEFASGKTFNNTIADRFFLIVDFSAVIDTTPFTRCPQAVHIDMEGKRTKIKHFRSPDAEVWYAKYENLGPGSRINLEWSMI